MKGGQGNVVGEGKYTQQQEPLKGGQVVGEGIYTDRQEPLKGRQLKVMGGG